MSAPAPFVALSCAFALLGTLSCATEPEDDGTPDSASAGGDHSGGRPSTSAGGQLTGVGGLPQSATGGEVGAAGGGFDSGGAPSSGGASPIGGAASTGGVSAAGGEATGGANGTGGAVELGPLFPANGSLQQCPDPSLRLRFEDAPSLGNTGMVRVHEVGNEGPAVATIDMSVAQTTDNIGGTSFNIPRPAYIHENEAIFVLPSGSLEYGRSYFVTMDSGVVTDPDGEAMEFSNPEDWQFSTQEGPPSDPSELRVSLDGTGDFCSVQGAVEATNGPSTLSVGAGAYYGLVYFTNKVGLTIRGDDRNATVIAGVNNNNLNPSTRGRALFGVEDVSDLTLENVTIHNQTPQGGSQAEALALLSCDRCSVRNATIKSLQDTLLWSGRIYAEDCLIEGNVDYIWGSGAAFFKDCEIKTVGRSGYNLQARNPASGYGYVFVDTKLTSDPGITGDVLARIDVSQYPASHVAYIDCEMGSHISAAGWTITGGGSTTGLRFFEYQSRKPDGSLVDTSGRASGSRQLTQSEAADMRDPALVLNGWTPSN